MFDVGFSEILVILLVALLVLGPKNLPKASRTIGKFLGEIRRMGWEFTSALQDEAENLERKEKRKTRPAPAKTEQPAESPAKTTGEQPAEDRSDQPAIEPSDDSFPRDDVADAAPKIRITSDKPEPAEEKEKS